LRRKKKKKKGNARHLPVSIATGRGHKKKKKRKDAAPYSFCNLGWRKRERGGGKRKFTIRHGTFVGQWQEKGRKGVCFNVEERGEKFRAKEGLGVQIGLEKREKKAPCRPVFVTKREKKKRKEPGIE